MRTRRFFLPATAILLAAAVVAAGLESPDAAPMADGQSSRTVRRTLDAYTYVEASRTTKVEFSPTDLLPDARGEAKLKNGDDGIEIEGSWRGLESPSQFGSELLTWVLWAVSPDGDVQNLGDIESDNGKGSLSAVTRFPAFSLIVTAEPYFAVPRPGEPVVLTSAPKGKAAEALHRAEADVDLLPRGSHALGRSEAELSLMLKADRRAPGVLLQARNALKIAGLSGADRFAAEELQMATAGLVEAEDLQLRRAGTSAIVAAARAAVEAGEVARQIASERAEAERLAAAKRAEERRAAEAQAAEKARLRAEQEAQTRAEFERRLAEEARLRSELEQRLRDQEARSGAVAGRGMTGSVSPAAPSPSPTGAQPADLAVERARLEAERSKLQSERLVLEANQNAEKARLEAERATLNATMQAELSAKQKEQDAATRSEIEKVRREAEQTRLEAEEARRAAVVAAEEAKLDAERARMEAELRIREAEVAALQRQAEAPPQPTAEQQALEAQERATIEAELAQQRALLEAERQALAEEQARRATSLESDRARLQSDRVRLEAEITQQAATLAAERMAFDRAREEAAQADADRRLAEQQQLEAEEKLQEERRRLEEERERLAAERIAAEALMQQAQIDAQRAREEEDARRTAERRTRLLGQLAMVLEATDTERGLMVNMSDVSFPPGRSDLVLSAREKLARVAGILLSYPSLTVEIEGHTDGTGSESGNMLISERRAMAVRDYLASQGVPPNSMIARGYGESRPVADDTTPDGRRKNRRVELLISGSLIDTGTRTVSQD